MKSTRLVILITAIIVLAGCASSNSNSKETAQARQQLGAYEQSQPVPQFAKSQIRQTAIDIENAQAGTTVTTSFFFNQGVQDPISSCASIGFPVASTVQLTNPLAKVPNHDLVINQIEPTGVYTGNSTGTYVLCVNAAGKPYAQYWEGFVNTVTGPASWNTTTHQVELTGEPTGGFTKVGG